MTKTIKICDKCGKECAWLYKIPFMAVKGHNIEFYDRPCGAVNNECCENCARKNGYNIAFYDDTPCGAANNEFCENCARKIVEKINDIVLL